jgi:hypothetical protein
MNVVVGFAKFWYDFIIGDDWTIALAVGIALAVLALLGHSGPWFLLPLVVIVILGLSLWRASR